MPYAYFMRITHPYEDIKHIISRWSLECDKMAVYQHIGTKTEKVHIHLVIEGCRIQAKQLRNIAQKMTQLPFNGQENMVAPELDPDRDPYKYMTKGIHEPSYYKGYDKDFLDAAKARYIPEKDLPRSAKQPEIRRLYESQVCGPNRDHVREEYKMFVQDNPATEVVFTQYLKTYVWKIAFNANGSMATAKCFLDNRTLFCTYIYTHNLKLPSGHKMEKWISW